MIRQTPRSTRTDTHFTYTRLFRSFQDSEQIAVHEVDIFRRGGFPVPQQNGRGAKGIDGILDLREILHERGLADIGRHLEVHLVAGLLALIIRSEEHTSELQSLMRISYAVFCLKKKNIKLHVT